MSFSNYTSQGVLNYLFGKTSVLDTQPTLHIGLSTTEPAEDGTGVTEPVGNAYARVATPEATWTNATNADPSSIDNNTPIVFTTPTGPWGTITHFVVFDALTLGNVIASGALNASKEPDDGDPVSFPAGDLSFTLD